MSERVLIARPGARAAALNHALAQHGFTPANLDAMSLVPLMPPETLSRFLFTSDAGRAPAIDMVVCVSPYAAHRLATYLSPRPDWMAQARLVATGRSTQQSLASLFDHASREILVPCPGEWSASEGLLANPQLQKLTGQSILLARGEGGRKSLVNAFKERGANVHEAVLYRRAMQTPPSLERAWLLNGEYSALIVTSAEQLGHLVQWCSDKSLARPLVVSSPRLEYLAVEKGFQRVLMAGDATPNALANACDFLHNP